MLAIALASLAFAADYDIAHADLRAASGYLNPAVLVGFNPQPEPPGDKSFEIVDGTAVLSVDYTERASAGIVLGVAEDRQGVKGIWVQAESVPRLDHAGRVGLRARRGEPRRGGHAGGRGRGAAALLSAAGRGSSGARAHHAPMFASIHGSRSAIHART